MERVTGGHTASSCLRHELRPHPNQDELVPYAVEPSSRAARSSSAATSSGPSPMTQVAETGLQSTRSWCDSRWLGSRSGGQVAGRVSVPCRLTATRVASVNPREGGLPDGVRSGVRRTTRLVASGTGECQPPGRDAPRSPLEWPRPLRAARNLTCSAGDLGTFSPELIKSGTYGTITVTGFCQIESGATVVVRAGLIVAPGGFLVASGVLDNFGQFPDCNRTITVSGGIRVGDSGSLFSATDREAAARSRPGRR